LGALTQPQAPVRRIGKIIPTGKAAKWLANRIHEGKSSTGYEDVKANGGLQTALVFVILNL
jgi:hypothetical protein